MSRFLSKNMAASPRMKIAFVNQPWDSAVPPVQAGSISIWTYEVARRLAKSNNVIIYARRGRSHKQEEYYEGVHYRRFSVMLDRVLNGLSRILYNKLSSAQKPFFASWMYSLGYALAIAQDLRSQNCDIVHIHNFSQFVPIIRTFNPQIKIVLHMHCEWLSQLDTATMEQRLRQVSLILGCSQYITEKVRSKFPHLAPIFQTVYNGVDIADFSQKNGSDIRPEKAAKKILFVGRISPEKGIHVLLDAFQKVLESYPQVKLDIIGPNHAAPTSFIVALTDDPKVAELAAFQPENYFSHLQSKVSPNIASQVSFVGNVPHLKLIERYREADILINPSLSEAFGMSLVEAIATGVPVIAARAGGMTEVVEEGETGLLVEPGNATELAAAILRLLSDKALWESMSQAGPQRVAERFSWEKIADKLLHSYQNIIQNQERVSFESSATPIL